MERIAEAWRDEGAPDAILTYHNYHKAPDLIGARPLAERFGCPYAIVEASRAPTPCAGARGRTASRWPTALSTPPTRSAR